MFESLAKELSQEPIWSIVGLLGQFTFGGRFILQWLVSEYKKKSHVPVAFWYLSMIGSIILLAYSIHRVEPIFILGFSLNSAIYIRNLHLIYKHKQTGEVTVVEKDED
ncbi:MAG: lipid-A-disaccharide synthase N-terminal domain-containing protein [Sedimentisphaerales bacterium]